MAEIPNTTNSGYYLTAVGNGSNASQWVPSSGGGGGGTVPTGTTTGQTLYWNNSTSAWTLATAPSANAQVMIWNSSTNVWAPKTISSDVTITNAGVATVAKINGSPLGTTVGANDGYALTWSNALSLWVPALPTLDGYPVNLIGINPTTDNGATIYFSNIGTYQFVATAPPYSNSIQYWNGLTWKPTVATSTSVEQYLKWTPGSPGSWSPSLVTQIQGMNVSGITSPSDGSLMYWSNLSNQWLFTNMSSTPGFGAIGNGSILYWDGGKYTFTPSPNGGGNGAVQWDDSLKKYTIVAVGGSTPNNDAWGSNPQSTAVSVGTSATQINSVVFNTDTYVYSKFLVTFSMAQSNAVSASATLSVYIDEGTAPNLVANFAVGQALTGARTSFSGSLVYAPSWTVATSSTMRLKCYWNTGSGQINFSTITVVGIV